MQHNTGDNLDLNKRQTWGVQYNTPPLPDGKMWDRLWDQMQAKQKPLWAHW